MTILPLDEIYITSRQDGENVQFLLQWEGLSVDLESGDSLADSLCHLETEAREVAYRVQELIKNEG